MVQPGKLRTYCDNNAAQPLHEAICPKQGSIAINERFKKRWMGFSSVLGTIVALLLAQGTHCFVTCGIVVHVGFLSDTLSAIDSAPGIG